MEKIELKPITYQAYYITNGRLCKIANKRKTYENALNDALNYTGTRYYPDSQRLIVQQEDYPERYEYGNFIYGKEMKTKIITIIENSGNIIFSLYK